MKKKFKLKIFSVLLLATMMLSGCNDGIVKEHINEPIAESGDLQYYMDMGYDARNERCKEKHIEVSGEIKDEGTGTYIEIGSKKEDDFYVTCWFDEEQDQLEEGDYLTLDGVCVYSFNDEMVVKGCTITEFLDADSSESEVAQKETESQIAMVTETIELESESEETITVVETETAAQTQPSTEVTLSVADIPAYSGNPYVAINDNVPQFLETDLTTTSYEYYSDLDNLGRCGVVYACIGQDLMPTEERGSIGHVKPTGWKTVKYDCVDGKYLYNRCHLIGYQLSGENANEKNLITGTRYMNMEGMLPFENMVADYVQETGNHVMYRVTPIFEGDNLLASGVQIEAQSVEDNGDGVFFNVFCYNVQPEVTIDYASGESGLDNAYADSANSGESIGNTNASENTEASSATVVPAPTPTFSCPSCGTSYSSQDEADVCNASHTPAPDTSSLSLVWISATGSKYHSINNCGRMNPNKASQMSEADAQSQGYEKCSKCW